MEMPVAVEDPSTAAFAESARAEVPGDEPPVDEPPVADPPVEDPATEEPPAEEPPPYEPPVQDPPPDDSPTDEHPPIWLRAAIEQVARSRHELTLVNRELGARLTRAIVVEPLSGLPAC
jgi:hypothetical protein